MGSPSCQYQAAAAEAEEAEKGDDGEVDKDDDKQTKLKPKQSPCHSKKKKKDTSFKRIKPPNDNLNEYFGQESVSQETVDVTPIDTPKKSEEAKLKNDPDGSNHRRVDKSPQGSAGEDPPKPSSKSRQPVQDSADSSHRKVHKSL